MHDYQKLQLTGKAVESILCGSNRREVLKQIEGNLPIDKETSLPVKLSPAKLTKIYHDAILWLEENTVQDAKTIIDMHTIFYEEIYQYFQEIGDVDGMNKAMFAKERLLGMHKQTTVAHVKRNKNINIIEPAEYDLSLLTPEERKQFESLINEATEE